MLRNVDLLFKFKNILLYNYPKEEFKQQLFIMELILEENLKIKFNSKMIFLSLKKHLKLISKIETERVEHFSINFFDVIQSSLKEKNFD